MSNLSTKWKLLIAALITIIYFIIILIIMIPWVTDLSLLMGFPLAILIIAGIAIIPGLLNIFMVSSVLLYKKDNKRDFQLMDEDISFIIAAHNEEGYIYKTIESIANQSYVGKKYVYIVNNNSTDNTEKVVNEAISKFNNPKCIVKYISEKVQGKNNALNTGLKYVNTKHFITLDADSILHPRAVRNIVNKIQKEKCAAVAGSIKVKNIKDNLLTRIQRWDYTISISAVKKMQSLFKSTLVAQGAFSIYDTEIIKKLNGWKDCIGEDIVLTWDLLSLGYHTYYEPKAVCFTTVPNKLKDLIIQRNRWARGMIEALRRHKPWTFLKNKYAIILTSMDIFIIYIDFSYLFFFIPGIILCLLGYPIIFGLISLLTIILNLISFSILFIHERAVCLKPLKLKEGTDPLSYVLFLVFYQFIMSPTAFVGYLKEWLNLKRQW